MQSDRSKNILIIKHSSLGDWIKATGFFKALREHFKDHNLFFITAEPYTQLAYSSGYFDNVWSDSREIYGNPRIFQKLAKHRYLHVFDLQSSIRTRMYKPFIKHSGKFWAIMRNSKEHNVEQFSNALKSMNIINRAEPCVDWLSTDLLHLNIPEKFVLLIPGCNAKYPNKRWTAAGYNKVIEWLNAQDITAVLIGSDDDKILLDQISSKNTINLINKIGFHGIAALARKALYVIGSDTGPTHIAAATGAKIIVPMSINTKRDYNSCKPWGNNTTLILKESLYTLDHATVINHLEKI